MTGFPSNPFDLPDTLYGSLGSFWRKWFHDRAALRSIYAGICEISMQFRTDFTEAVNLLGVGTAPVFHTRRLMRFSVKESEMKSGQLRSLRYSPSGPSYGPQPSPAVYGVPGQTFIYGGSGMAFTMDIPDGLKFGRFFITDRSRNPGIVWFGGIDFLVDSRSGAMFFARNPFDVDGFGARPVYDGNGVQVDREIDMWLWMSEWDRRYLYEHFGYILGLPAESGEWYKTALVEYWDMLSSGASIGNLRAFISGLVGIPVALGDEKVELVLSYPDRNQIITDGNVYSAPKSADPVVSAGDGVRYGDELFDSFSVVELSGASYDGSRPGSLSLGSEFLSGGYAGDLTFENAAVPLEWYGYDEDGKAVVRFAVSGSASDVQIFWDNMLKNGKELGQTLAELLDTRENPAGQPYPSVLPAEINPMQFIVENFIGNNLVVIDINLDDADSSAPGVEHLRLLRNMLPPHTAAVINISGAVPA